MKLYGDLSNITQAEFCTILEYFYSACNKVTIYLPNDGDTAIATFKERFLSATDLCEIEDESSVLEPKEGFSMVIASLSEAVQSLLKEISTGFHLSFGLMHDEDLILFIGEDGEIAIDSTDESFETHALRNKFKNC